MGIAVNSAVIGCSDLLFLSFSLSFSLSFYPLTHTLTHLLIHSFIRIGCLAFPILMYLIDTVVMVMVVVVVVVLVMMVVEVLCNSTSLPLPTSPPFCTHPSFSSLHILHYLNLPLSTSSYITCSRIFKGFRNVDANKLFSIDDLSLTWSNGVNLR